MYPKLDSEKLNEISFMYELEAIQPALAWLYIVSDRPIQCAYDSYSLAAPCDHATIINLAKSANKIVMAKHGLGDEFYPLALALSYGAGLLAAAGVGSPDDRAIVFVAKVMSEQPCNFLQR